MKKLLVCILICITALSVFGCKEDEKEKIESTVYNYILNLDDPTKYLILGEYTDIEVNLIKVTEGDIEQYKADLQNDYSYFKVIEDKKTVELGDNINVTFTGYQDGAAFEGGDGWDDFVVGDGKFVFPSVEQELIGVKVGNTLSALVLVPDDYFSIGLRGKTIKLDVTVTQIQEKIKTAPELDLDFIGSNFGLNSLEDFDDYIVGVLEKAVTDEMMENAWKAAVSNSAMIDYPKGLIDDYISEMYDYYKSQAVKYGVSVELYIGDINEWKEEATEYARDYFKAELVMYCILDKEFGREIEEEEYQQRLEAFAKDEGVSVSRLKTAYSDDELKVFMYWDKVMELVWEKSVLV